MRNTLRILSRRILARTPLRRFLFPRYQYSFTPSQLGFMVDTLIDSLQHTGDVIEVGCFVGATTVFLNAEIQRRDPERRYIAIDTFSGFVSEDLEYETSVRGKRRQDIDDCLFRMNSQKWFDYTMRLNGYRNVTSLKADVNQLDFDLVTKQVAFALIDVDFQRPVSAALDALYPKLAPGGTILVDDCKANTTYDGALLAYESFCSKHKLPPTIAADKIGIIRKEVDQA